MLAQSVFRSPRSVSSNVTVPALWTAASGLPSPAVVHASTKVLPVWLLTVTFSVVGVGA